MKGISLQFAKCTNRSPIKRHKSEPLQIIGSLARGFALTVAIVSCVPELPLAEQASRTARTFVAGFEYDARQFLSNTQQTSFRRAYPDFDQPRVEKAWEWRDVDPLGLSNPALNRARRRDLFLQEYSFSLGPGDQEAANPDQQAYRAVLDTQFDQATILMTDRTIKISTVYTESYESKLPVKNLLEKLAQTGVQWALLGGTNLYIYNGTILLGRYRSGCVSVADLRIDRPLQRQSIKPPIKQ